MQQRLKWRRPTSREIRLYAFLYAFAILFLEALLISEVGVDLPLIGFSLVVALGWAILLIPAGHLVRLFILRGSGDRWTDE
jgi:hypothetical protein